MATIDLRIKYDLYVELKELRDTLGLKSFSDLLKQLKDNYLNAPAGVPVDAFNRKRDAYMGSYPDEFRKTVRMCIGVTDPQEFDAVFEETIHEMIKAAETAPEEMIILQCAHCHHVWDYKGKQNLDKIGQIHCPLCQATASGKWIRELKMPEGTN